MRPEMIKLNLAVLQFSVPDTETKLRQTNAYTFLSHQSQRVSFHKVYNCVTI